MPDYSNGKIYRIICNNTGNMYIGSTCCALSRRLAQHKSDYNKGKNEVASFDIIKEGNYQIVLIENVPCNNKEELLRRERYYIENMNCVNKVVPLRTDKEYYEDNKREILEKNKQYRKTNKDIISEKSKQYREANKDHLQEWHKHYYEDNKEKIIEKVKEYYEVNKQKISERKMKPFQCQCGSIVRIGDKGQHFKTKKHIAYLESLKETN